MIPERMLEKKSRLTNETSVRQALLLLNDSHEHSVCLLASQSLIFNAGTLIKYNEYAVSVQEIDDESN